MLEPKQLEERRHHRIKTQRRKRRSFGIVPAVLFMVGIYVLVVAVMPLRALQVESSYTTLPEKPASKLMWPGYGQAAIGAVGYGLLSNQGDQKPLPTASVAKVFTALAVLKERPIIAGQQMPMLTMTTADVSKYREYAAQGQSVIAVEAGVQLTEYQALQALLLPSANNMAETLTIWAFGSTDNYLKFANPFAKTLGMNNTHIADASGFSPQTVSTAVDLAKLAEIAMNHPIIAEIVGQAQATLPVAGTVYNVNNLIGNDGVVGIKTGTTDEAGGCYMFAVKRAVGGERDVTLVGVILGAESRSIAISDAMALFESAFKLFKKTDIIYDSQIFGKINQIDGKTSAIVSNKKLSLVTWDNKMPKVEISTKALDSSVKQGDEVGSADIKSGDMVYSLPLTASGNIQSPSLLWRIRHAAGYL